MFSRRVNIPESLSAVCDQLSKLPGIGYKTAYRLTFFIISRPPEESLALARSIEELIGKVKYCSVCFNLTESDPCPICSDKSRDRGVICVVENPNDLFAIEETGEYHGLYHILGGAIAPLDGIEPDQLHITELVERLKDDEVREVILATNPNTEGDVTAAYLVKIIKPLGIKISKIARGLPSGSDLEFADKSTLKRALKGRTDE
ncbi:recombination protein RecR [bacterium]|nr:recombination protein RecR [bacterium]